jgi:uncharacterized hydrophobic protein (TIGR00271 family)
MPSIAGTDLERMRDGLLFAGPDRSRKLSRFWVLLVLAAVIASAGVIADSTATVIGAMIVAPLMTPILGTVLAISIGDLRQVLWSLALVIAGAAVVVLIAWAMGRGVRFDVVAETNGQVAGRVHPRLIDLIAAIATGAVGAFALVRDDVSDALPGVAIAISLVPPLAVVGLTLESGSTTDAWGALLLFLTNVGAILLSGLIVMALYRVSRASEREGRSSLRRRGAILLVVLFVVALAIPLNVTTVRVVGEATSRRDAQRVASAWAEPAGWRVAAVENVREGIRVRVYGPLPAPSTTELRELFDAGGLRDVDVVLELIPQQTVELPAS